MSLQIYSERKVLARVAGHEASALDITVFQDTAQTLPAGLELALDLRIFGAVVTNTCRQPLKDEDVTLTFVEPNAGNVSGRITNVQAIDASGKPVAWAQAHAGSFTLTATAAVAPVEILTVLPGLPAMLRPLAALLGGKVHVDIGSTTVIAPLHAHTAGTGAR